MNFISISILLFTVALIFLIIGIVKNKDFKKIGCNNLCYTFSFWMFIVTAGYFTDNIIKYNEQNVEYAIEISESAQINDISDLENSDSTYVIKVYVFFN